MEPGELFLRIFCDSEKPLPKGASEFVRPAPLRVAGPGRAATRCRSPSHGARSCVCRHQLETPGHYSHLAAFYEDKKGVLHAGSGRGGGLPPVYWLPSIHRYMYPEMKVSSAVLSLVLDLGLGTAVLN